jgi:hypothetical protein
MGNSTYTKGLNKANRERVAAGLLPSYGPGYAVVPREVSSVRGVDSVSSCGYSVREGKKASRYTTDSGRTRYMTGTYVTDAPSRVLNR